MAWLGAVFPIDVEQVRKDIREFRERRAMVELAGAAKVLEMADRMRQRGGGSPASLYGACVAAFSRNEIPYDEVTRLYRHACLHAGIVVPRDRRRLLVCPECEKPLD